MKKVEKTAVLHVHTNYSDGTGTPAEVIKAAQNADVDILGFNDHNNLKLRDEGFGGWQDGLFVLAGAELQDENDQNHLLVYGIDTLPDTSDTIKQIEYVNEHGGIAIVAHPFEKPGKLPNTKSYLWTLGVMDGLSGVEIWNYMSEWKANISILDFSKRYKYPDNYVVSPDMKAVSFREQIGGCAVGGPDAHNFRGGGPLNLSIFPYEVLMKKIRTHILLDEELPGETDSAEMIIVDALRNGNCFVSNAVYGDARGFRCNKLPTAVQVILPCAGNVTVTSNMRVLFDERLEAGEHFLDISIIEGCTVIVSRDERIWISCGI